MDSQFPLYLVMGMSYELYWEGSPNLAKAYRKAYRLNQENKNYELWLGGLYTFSAFTTALGNAFRKKGTKPETYPTKPFEIFDKTKEEKEQEKKQELEKVKKSLDAWRNAWISKYGNKQS